MNLILTVSNRKVISKKFIKTSVDSTIFINFLSELLNQLTEEEKNKVMIVMDNASFHLSNDVLEFFNDNKLRGITICPYRSYFNMIELVFRYIKNIIYKNVFTKMDDLKKKLLKL